MYHKAITAHEIVSIGGGRHVNISLITSEESFGNNYGAVLQGFALSRVITSFDDSVKIIRYRGGDFDTDVTHGHINVFRRLINNVIKHSRVYVRQWNERKGIRCQKKYFRVFQDAHLYFWNKHRVGWRKLRKRFPIADVYICGSDQIWNPYYKRGYNDPGYFLGFAPAGKKRIAYAPSFGCDDIPLSAQKDLKKYIDQFAHVSVREKEGAAIIAKYAQREACIVADPTLLLTSAQWCEIATLPDKLPDKFILCYRFMPNDEMRNCIDYLSESLHLPVISLPLSQLSLRDPYEKEFRAGPSEFIGMIKAATLVCTDSFHATVFSLLMETPFYTFEDLGVGKAGRNMNSRIRNVIGIAQLQNRVIRNKEDINMDQVLEVDFSTFRKDVAQQRDASIKWLYNAIHS